MPKNLPARTIGLPWFRKEDFAALRRIFVDGGNMHDTWEEWLESSEKLEAAIKAQRGTVERVYIDPATFPAWCKANGASADSKGRQTFVASVIAAKYGNTH